MQRTALLLRDLLADYPERNGIGPRSSSCEHEGDRIAHDIIHRARRAAAAARAPRRRPTSTRSTGALDDIVDFAEEAADQLAPLRRRGADGAGLQIAEVLVARGRAGRRALRGLREGVDVAPHCVEIHRLENEARPAWCATRSRRCSPTASTRWS